jgi:hypothetical protein
MTTQENKKRKIQASDENNNTITLNSSTEETFDVVDIYNTEHKIYPCAHELDKITIPVDTNNFKVLDCE